MYRFLLMMAFVFCSVTVSNAETIIKFDLGSAGADFQLDSGILTTIDDGDASTLGDQNTNVNFTGFLAGMTDIVTDIASFSLSSVALDGAATIVGGTVAVQPTTGGEFHLWDDLNNLLLAGSIDSGSITAALGSSATGSFFNISLDNFTGGSLASLLDPNSLGLSMSFTDVNDGVGFSVVSDTLQPFQAAGTANISAFVPEPELHVITLIAFLGICFRRRK